MKYLILLLSIVLLANFAGDVYQTDAIVTVNRNAESTRNTLGQFYSEQESENRKVRERLNALEIPRGEK